MRAMLLVVGLSACGSPASNMGPAVDLSQFDTSCNTSADCLAVTTYPCGCGCLNAAIKASEQQKFQAASRAITCGAPITCGDCAAPTALMCTGGHCAL